MPSRLRFVWCCHTAATPSSDRCGDGGGRNPASTIQPITTRTMPTGPVHASRSSLRSVSVMALLGLGVEQGADREPAYRVDGRRELLGLEGRRVAAQPIDQGEDDADRELG